jgi:CubicO group peptidase (beta-lactamase class C family)
MVIVRQLTRQFDPVADHVYQTHEAVEASGSAAIVIHNGLVVTEAYRGSQADDSNARPVQADTQFLVASVRKSYIGFAVAYAVYHGFIGSIDDRVTKYLPELDEDLLDGTTIRHLLTHTHGLRSNQGAVHRDFPPGHSWAYRGVSIEMLTEIVKLATGKTIAAIVTEQVFQPLGFQESGWYAAKHENLADVLRDADDPSWNTSDSTDGDKMNMYVSARELAYWGCFHLQMGAVNGRQIVPKEVIALATSLQSPSLSDPNLPQNGFLWFVKDLPAAKTEIGERIPKGSYQILGYTGVALLVIPEHRLVAARMFNRYGSPPAYNYLTDIRGFGDTVMACI